MCPTQPMFSFPQEQPPLCYSEVPNPVFRPPVPPCPVHHEPEQPSKKMIAIAESKRRPSRPPTPSMVAESTKKALLSRREGASKRKKSVTKGGDGGARRMLNQYWRCGVVAYDDGSLSTIDAQAIRVPSTTGFGASIQPHLLLYYVVSARVPER